MQDPYVERKGDRWGKEIPPGYAAARRRPLGKFPSGKTPPSPVPGLTPAQRARVERAVADEPIEDFLAEVESDEFVTRLKAARVALGLDREENPEFDARLEMAKRAIGVAEDDDLVHRVNTARRALGLELGGQS